MDTNIAAAYRRILTLQHDRAEDAREPIVYLLNRAKVSAARPRIHLQAALQIGEYGRTFGYRGRVHKAATTLRILSEFIQRHREALARPALNGWRHCRSHRHNADWSQTVGEGDLSTMYTFGSFYPLPILNTTNGGTNVAWEDVPEEAAECALTNELYFFVSPLVTLYHETYQTQA